MRSESPTSSEPIGGAGYALDGWETNPNVPLGGVYADIYNYSPWVQQGSLVDAFVMLADNDAHWAQVGWIEHPNGIRSSFYEARQANGQIDENVYLTPYPEGSTHLYEVLYNNTPGYYTFYIDGQLLIEFQLGFTPTNAQEFGEVHNWKDQMAGSTSQFEVFADAHVYQGGWRTFSGGGYDQSDWWGNDTYSATQDWIWDQRCSS